MKLNGKPIIFICNIHSRVYRIGEWIKAPYLETAKEANRDKLNYIIRDCDICKEEKNKG